jgi:cytochrome bd-type quinol oxidase subunit 2
VASARDRPRVHATALAITALISLAYLVVPVYATDGGRSTVVEANGGWVVLVLAAPIAIALLPLLAPARGRRGVNRCAATAMTLFALVTGFTIGTPYLLPATLMWMASLARGSGVSRRGRVLSV